MLQLIRLASFECVEESHLSIFQEETLLSVGFEGRGFALVADRSLTQFRFERASGALVSFELRGGVLCGIELLGVVAGRWDQTVERFSEEVPRKYEIPLLGVELDGKNSYAKVDISAISQAREFRLTWAVSTSTLEVLFGNIDSASDFGCGSLLYNDGGVVVGARLVLDSLVL